MDLSFKRILGRVMSVVEVEVEDSTERAVGILVKLVVLEKENRESKLRFGVDIQLLPLFLCLFVNP